MTDVWNMREVRDYPGGLSGNPVQTMQNWITGQNFKVTNNDPNMIQAEKNGIHVNFKPELTLVFSTSPNGTQVAMSYCAHLKVASAAVVGVLTGGLSTLVGAGTFTAHIADANQFVRSLFQVLEGLAVRPPSVVLSRTGFEDSRSAPVSGSPALPPKSQPQPQPQPPQGSQTPPPQQPGYPAYPQNPAPGQGYPGYPPPGQQPGYPPPQPGYPPAQGYPPYPQQQPGGYAPQPGYPPYGQQYPPYPGTQTPYGQQPGAPQQYQQGPYPPQPQYAQQNAPYPPQPGQQPSPSQSPQLTQQMGGLSLGQPTQPSGGYQDPNQPHPQQAQQLQQPYPPSTQGQPGNAYPGAVPPSAEHGQVSSYASLSQSAPAVPATAQQSATRPPLIPTNPDFKTLSAEELDQLLAYHKETAWKIERELMERKVKV